jgi:hypothetical protein
LCRPPRVAVIASRMPGVAILPSFRDALRPAQADGQPARTTCGAWSPAEGSTPPRQEARRPRPADRRDDAEALCRGGGSRSVRWCIGCIEGSRDWAVSTWRCGQRTREMPLARARATRRPQLRRMGSSARTKDARPAPHHPHRMGQCRGPTRRTRRACGARRRHTVVWRYSLGNRPQPEPPNSPVSSPPAGSLASLPYLTSSSTTERHTPRRPGTADANSILDRPTARNGCRDREGAPPV